MSPKWVDFKAIKSAVSMEMVLAHYNVRVRKVNQSYLRGRCPLPTHASKESADSFGVHIGKNAWACQSQSCVEARSGRRGGNILDFVAAMEGSSIRDSAAMIADWFNVPSCSRGDTAGGNGQLNGSSPDEKEVMGVEATDSTLASAENKPLGFALKNLDRSHPYFISRGVSPETAEEFGIGIFSGKGMMAGRAVIPIHNSSGALVAYAGRSIDGSEPKYKLPAGFQKSIELFNMHRAREKGSGCVIVVEGFFDCVKVHQAGYPHVVALMGSSMSNTQEELLASFSRVTLMLDGDDPGREATHAIAARLTHRTFTKVVNVPAGKQPDELPSKALQALLGSL